ncbi:hypothetical protein GmHk_05G012940 [Glycine max]|nr:hypothetical protein GmHk_05G012940 [Glycine max]
MMEREMIIMIVDTLPVFYYEKMLGYTPSSFTDFVFVGKRIEVGLRRGKFDYPTLMNMKPRANGESENEGGTHDGRGFPENKLAEFTPIPMPYADILPYLLDNAMAVISPTKTPQPLFPRRYNLNMTCAYHGGVLGHSIEHCKTLKHKVQSLIDAGWLKFEEDNRS